jgi:enoyl-CoA hydratase/carnithine racemase
MRAAGFFATVIVSGVIPGVGSSDSHLHLASPALAAAVGGSVRPVVPTDDADPATRKVTGEIASLQQNVLIIKDKEGMLRSLKTSSATTVTLDGKAATLATLKTGDQVEAVVAEMETTTRITATRPKK